MHQNFFRRSFRINLNSTSTSNDCFVAVAFQLLCMWPFDAIKHTQSFYNSAILQLITIAQHSNYMLWFASRIIWHCFRYTFYMNIRQGVKTFAWFEIKINDKSCKGTEYTNTNTHSHSINIYMYTYLSDQKPFVSVSLSLYLSLDN